MTRKKGDFFKDLFLLGMHLPSWVSALAAVATFVGFRLLANMEQPGAGVEGSAVARALVTSIATFLQYMVPAFLLTGMAMRLLKQGRGNVLLKGIRGHKQSVGDLSWFEFEMLLEAGFRHQGYKVQHGLPGPDAGVDLRLRGDEGTVLVQCKHWRSSKVGVNVVRELLGSMKAENVNAGKVVCSGAFTRGAKEFAAANGIDLIDGGKLSQWLRRERRQHPPIAPSMDAPSNKSCPRCNALMVVRKARRGQHQGQQFWGCTRFPQCRGTRSL